MTDEKKGKTDQKIKDLQLVTDNLFERFDELDERVDRLEENITRRIDRIETNQEKMMTTLDSIAGILQDRRDEEAAGTVWLKRHDQQITDHEGRIRKLENRRRLMPASRASRSLGVGRRTLFSYMAEARTREPAVSSH